MYKFIHLLIHPDPGLLKRDLRAMISESLAEGLQFWWEVFLPGHFTAEAKSKYNEPQGSAEYNHYKQKKKGHQIPFVWSGASRDALTRQMSLKTPKSRAAAEGRMEAPRHFFIRRPSYVNKVEYLTKTTGTEHHQIVARVETALRRRIDEVHGTPTKKIA